MRQIRGKGVTLLETVLASTIFAMVSIGLLSIWYSHYRLQAATQHRLVASYVCKQLMEEQLNQAPSSIVPLARGTQPAITVNSTINGVPRQVVYDWAVKTIDTAYTRDVTVQVYWREADVEHEFHLETLLITAF